nr:MAG TPA: RECOMBINATION ENDONUCLEASE VII [Caudoviricetes sp.]
MHLKNKRKSISKATRRAVFEKYGGHCAYCGTEITMKTMQIDHLTPLVYARFGVPNIDTTENYMPACRSCNHYKSTLSLEKFRDMLERQPEILARDSVTYRIAVRFGTVQPTPHKITFYFEKFQ